MNNYSPLPKSNSGVENVFLQKNLLKWFNMLENKTFVVSLGGSVMYPDRLDEKFIKNFRDFVLRFVKNGYRFIITTGGGKLCRIYQGTALKIGKASSDQMDWLGIETTRLNALLLKVLLSKKAHPALLDQRKKIKSFGKYPIIIGCGWTPGWSTDFITVQTAIDFKIKTVLNLSNIAYVYTADPKKNAEAQALKQLTWNDYLKIIPRKRTPGMNTPFDPVASRLAQKNNITVIVADGRNIANFQKIITEKKFKGTTITN